MFATKNAATVTALACVPSSEPMPMTKDSGIPSSSVPAAIASPAVGFCRAQGLQPDRLRCSPPAALMNALQSAKMTAPNRRPPTGQCQSAPLVSPIYQIEGHDRDQDTCAERHHARECALRKRQPVARCCADQERRASNQAKKGGFKCGHSSPAQQRRRQDC